MDTTPVITVQDDILDLVLSGRLTPTDAMRNALLTVERDRQACAPAEENIILRLFLRALTGDVPLPERPLDANTERLLAISHQSSV